jgi:hypothetical protein
MPPPPWGLLGAAWRLAPSHQLVGALDPSRSHLGKRPEHEVPDLAHGGVGPGAPRSGPEGAGGQVGLGSSRSLAGFGPAKPKNGGLKRRSKGWHGSSVGATAVPLRCYCGALTNHRAQVECVTGRSAPPRSFRRCRVGGFGPSAI